MVGWLWRGYVMCRIAYCLLNLSFQYPLVYAVFPFVFPEKSHTVADLHGLSDASFHSRWYRNLS